jgi:hypothetical protein
MISRAVVNAIPNWDQQTTVQFQGNPLRKEVIQPQVPLRLPCYDLVPITGFTVGASPPEGLGQRLKVPPAFMA